MARARCSARWCIALLSSFKRSEGVFACHPHANYVLFRCEIHTAMLHTSTRLLSPNSLAGFDGLAIGLGFGLMALSTSAHAGFVGYFVSSTNVTADPALGGPALVVYTLTARFTGSHDAVSRAFNLTTADPDNLLGFWHKDLHGDPATNGLLSQRYGTWDPTKTGSAALNRPFDSYLTIGGIAQADNSTEPISDWLDGGHQSSRGWSRPDLPDNGMLGWFNSEDENSQGTVGHSPGVAPTDVRLGQFVLSAGHAARTFDLTIRYGHEHSLSDDEYSATSTFTLGAVPAPSAVGLLALAGLGVARRRR